MGSCRHSKVIAVLGLVLGAERGACATECAPGTAQSTCFDADPLWIPASPSRFIGIPSARAMPTGALSLGVEANYLARPVVLSTASPSPGGRGVDVVDQVLDAALSAAYSPARSLELDVVLPFALYRTGTGLTGITSQDGPSLASQALRDIRLGGGYGLWSGEFGEQPTRLSLMTRLGVSLPTGAAASFAGARGPVVAPSVGFALGHGVFFMGLEEAVRFREPVELGGTKLGTQLVSTLGLGANLLDRDRLSVALEGWLMPSLVSQTHLLLDGTLVKESVLPAEWMASVRTRAQSLTLSIGGGTALPLSDATRTGTDGATSTSHFAAVTSPDFRVTLVVRYQYVPADER